MIEQQHCVKLPKYGFTLNRIFPRENTSLRKTRVLSCFTQCESQQSNAEYQATVLETIENYKIHPTNIRIKASIVIAYPKMSSQIGSHIIFTCSKSTIETPKKDAKYVQS